MKRDIVKKAGVVVMSRDLKTIALVYRPEKMDWTFPKGHIESDETYVETAMREVLEETGMLVEVIGILPDMEYLNDDSRSISVKMLLTIFVKNNLDGKIGDEQVKWVPIDDVIQKLTYSNLKEYFLLILVILKKVTL